MLFSRDKFFGGARDWLGALTTQQVDGLNFLVDSIEKDQFLTRIEWPAYLLATVTEETAHMFQPIHEYGGHNYFVQRYGSQTKVGKQLGNLTPEEGATFAGDGDVQLTGRTNYVKANAELSEQYPDLIAQFEARTRTKFDLKHNPAEAGDPVIAYAVMSYGMRSGMFTGKSLQTYTKAKGFDSMNARRIINGLDRAALIAADYKQWLSILTDSLITADATASTAAVDPAGSQVSPQDGPTQNTVDDPGPGADASAAGADAPGDGDQSAVGGPQSTPQADPTLPRPSFWDRLTNWQGRAAQLQSFRASLSPISGDSKFAFYSTKIMGWLMLGLGFLGNHWLWVVGLVLIVAALGYLIFAKRNAANRVAAFQSAPVQSQTVVVK